MNNNCQRDWNISSTNTDKGTLFAAMIAHEIKNTLTTIKGVMKLIQEGEEKEEYFQLAEAEIERTEDFLTQLLTVSGPQTKENNHFQVSGLLGQVVSLLHQEADAHGVEIVEKFAADLPPLCGNRDQLKQAFINFLKNGIEAMPEGGKIIIEALRIEQEIIIRFTDTGCGMPEKFISKIGRPFLTTKENGTGLGIMISQKIIEKHHGRLSILSEENKGTLIEIRFHV